MRTIAYGPDAAQVADLYLPAAASGASAPDAAPVICLIHGGFWRLPYGCDHIAPIAQDLARRGFAVWNLEYRRMGAPGGGWPGTLEDIGAGIDHLASLAAGGAAIDLRSVTAVGHSAGGQLALWCARRPAPPRVRVTAVAGLAPVADLRLAQALGCSNGAVRDFLGGTPDEVPERYRTCSPLQMLPLGVPQLLIHGTHDEDVPIGISRGYAAAAAAAGDTVQFMELEDAGHMELIDPHGVAHAHLCAWLAARRGARSGA